MTDINAKVKQLFSERKYGHALKFLKKQTKKMPNDAEIERLIGVTLIQLKKITIAEKHLKKSYFLNPDSLPTLLNLASLYREQGDFESALSRIAMVLQKEPNNLSAIFNLSNTYRMMEQWEKAIESYQKLLVLNPNHVPALTTLALIKKNAGDVDESIKLFKKALSIDPFNQSIYLSLANLKNYQFTKDEIDIISTLIDKASDTQSTELLFAKAQYLEHVENYQDAFNFLERANQAHYKKIKRSGYDWKGYSNRIIEVFSQFQIQQPQKSLNNQPRPLFIVSMPRSGSTLVEQIVASHSSVFGASELSTFPHLVSEIESQTQKNFPESWAELTSDELEGVAEQYQDKISSYGSEFTYVCDKNLMNFHYIGAILSAMPNSLFIHCKRHPMDVCLSCYKQLFNAGQEYSYNLKELTEYYKHHEEIMAYWKQRFPDQIITVQYEELINDIESHVTDILNFLQLPWQDACVEFHKTKRMIRTASAAQVTQKIYKTASHRYKKYGTSLEQLEGYLKPFL